jgi:hypothetical protein
VVLRVSRHLLGNGSSHGNAEQRQLPTTGEPLRPSLTYPQQPLQARTSLLQEAALLVRALRAAGFPRV